MARATISSFLEYENGVESQKTNVLCSEDCLRGVFIGNLDVRHSNSMLGTFKLVIDVQAYMMDKFRVNLLSFGDLILASEIKMESKGTNHFKVRLHFEVRLSAPYF